MPGPAPERITSPHITTACLDMAGTTVADDGTVLAAFSAAAEQAGLLPGSPGHDQAMAVVRKSMGQSKIEVFRRVLGNEPGAQRANSIFEDHYARSVRSGQVAPLPGAEQTLAALRAAGIKVCLATGFAPGDQGRPAGRPGLAVPDRPGAVPGRRRPWPALARPAADRAAAAGRGSGQRTRGRRGHAQ
jgi:phosphoglycolate phosphatase